MHTYLFYDIETTGLSKSFDQILHFAAIRTDLNLKEIERYELKIKLNPDVIPSPYALITHKMGINEIQTGTAEFDAIKQIHHWLNTPGTISLGYNTLGFDDEFLRFSFYRNLLKPYTHQYANQCYRMDIYPMAVMFFLFKNTVIQWPEINGRVSFKLESINTANQFISGRSHHAMVDVEVTLELARRFLKEREMWDYLQGSFKKEVDKARMQQVQQETALLVSGKLGAATHFQCPVLFLGNHRHYTNQSVWLRLDNEEFTTIIPETISEKSRSFFKKPGEPNFILPYKDRFLQRLTPERIQLAEKNKQWLQTHPDMATAIIDYHTHYKYPAFPDTDIDASLYLNGFWSAEEEFFCQRFHAVAWEEKGKLLQQTASDKLKMLALRILGRHNLALLSGKEAAEFEEYLQRVNADNLENTLIDYQGKKRLTPRVALGEITQLREEKQLDEADLGLLVELEDYLMGVFGLSGGHAALCPPDIAQ